MIKFILYISFFILAGLSSCSDLSETVTYDPDSVDYEGENTETLYPTIQNVSPGKLQSLDIPEVYPTDINPDAGMYIALFTHIMENDNGEMNSAFSLIENGSIIPHNIEPSSSSNFFVITPTSGVFLPGSVYDLRVYRYAYVDDDAALPLTFKPLVELPATALQPEDPSYVSYRYKSADSPVLDTTPPSLMASSPADGDTNISVTLAGSGGRIILTFQDNSNPVINPLTVDNTTITLSDGGTIPTSVTIEAGDINCKTYYVQPLGALAPSTVHTLTLSVGNTIQDASGNNMPQTAITFTTEP